MKLGRVALGLSVTVGAAAAIGAMENPTWTLQGSFPDPGGRTRVEDGGQVSVTPPLENAANPRAVTVPNCGHSPLCDNRMGGVGVKVRQDLQRVEWKANLGYAYAYPYTLPVGFGGLPAVALDSKGNLWAFKRASAH